MQQPPETQPNNADAQTPMKADLSRWQRKALKKIGQSVPFDSDVIPADIRDVIESGLPACKTEADVRKLFVVNVKSEIILLAEAINRVVK